MSKILLDELENNLKDPKKSAELEVAFSDIITGIGQSWNLTNQELAILLGVKVQEIKDWTAEWGQVPLRELSFEKKSNLIDFVKIYNLIASIMVHSKDQIDLFKKIKFKELGDMTIIDFISKDPISNMNLVKIMISQKF